MTSPPSSAVHIEDRGDRRLVTIAGPHYDFDGRHENAETFSTFYSRELLEVILAQKGALYLKDEIMRAEDPRYLHDALAAALRPVGPLGKLRCLDFGGGGGASSVILCRLGATDVHGVDTNAARLNLARLRARDCGCGDAVAVHHVEDTRRLPFADGRFDLVLCNAVLEHIPPPSRQAHLTELWRVLRLGGHVVIIDTPNRWWPVERHTTGLPLLPFLPLRLARWYAVHCSSRVTAKDTVETLLARGMRGVSWGEIRRGFPGCEWLPNDDIRRCFPVLSGQSPWWKRPLRRLRNSVYHLLEATVCRALRLPVVAFFPSWSLCLRKPVADG